MLPILQLLGDQQEHFLRDIIDQLAAHFGLSQDERNQLLPSGTQPVFANRAAWGRTYLGKAGLLETVGRGKIRITTRGLDVLKSQPPAINIALLNQFPEFEAFHRASPKAEAPATAEVETPEEAMESNHQGLRAALALDLLDRIKKCSPQFFERLVVDLLVAMGYGGSRKDAGEAVGRSGDGGIDGIIKEDRLGLDIVYIQAKRWESTVGRPQVQAFAGSLEGHRARKGVFITTSQFTPDAREYVTRIEKKIVLIDGERLAQFMIDHHVGVTHVATYQVKKVDADYFGDGA